MLKREHLCEPSHPWRWQFGACPSCEGAKKWSQGGERWTNGVISPTLFGAQPTWQPRNSKLPSPGPGGADISQPSSFHQHTSVCTRGRSEKARPIKHASLRHMSVLELYSLFVVDGSGCGNRKRRPHFLSTQKGEAEMIRANALPILYDITRRAAIISAEHLVNVRVKE